jgi:hypothetical protein
MKKLLRLLLIGSIIAVVWHLITYRRGENHLKWEEVLSAVPTPTMGRTPENTPFYEPEFG